MEIRTLNEKETAILEEILKPYGYRLQGGSIEFRESGEVWCHMDLYTGPVADIGQKLGETVKKELEVDKVFLGSIQIA